MSLILARRGIIKPIPIVVTGTAYVTSITPNAGRADGPYRAGIRFTVGASPISVVSLGRWVMSGNSLSHTIRLVRASDRVDLGTASLNTSGKPAAAFSFVDLGSPVNLLANTSYYCVSDEGNGDSWQDSSISAITTNVAVHMGAVYSGDAGGSYNEVGGAGDGYAATNFKYT